MIGSSFLRSKGESSDGADFNAKRVPLAEIARHGFMGVRVNHRCTVGAGIDAGFTAHTPLRVCNHGLGFRDSLPCAGRADLDAGSIGAVLADNWQIDCDLSPFLDLDTGKGRGGAAFVREAADHFTGLTARAEIRKN
jgi:hypothetical protein